MVFFADGQVPPERGPLRGRLRALDREAGRAGPVLHVMVFSKKKERFKGKFIRVPDCLPPNEYLRCVYFFSCQKCAIFFFMWICPPPLPLPSSTPLFFDIFDLCFESRNIPGGWQCSVVASL